MTPIKVHYQNGQTEALTFTPLTNTERYKYIDLLVAGDTPGIVALCARRNENWVNSLTEDSFAELAQRFFQEVFPSAAKMADRDPVASLKITPIRIRLYSMLQTARKEGIFESDSAPGPTSSSTPAPAAANGDGSPSAPAPADSAPGATSTT